MSKRLLIFISAILVSETGIFLWATYFSSALAYQLAARYSARLSFFIFSGILLWSGLRGLRSIYSGETSKRLLVDLLLVFSVNHVIHFFFLAMNFRVSGQSLLSIRNAGGAVVYLMIMAAPVYLWNKQTMSRRLYFFVYSFFLIVTLLFFLTYVGRLSKELPMPTPDGFFIFALATIGGLVSLNVYRMWAEHRHVPLSTP